MNPAPSLETLVAGMPLKQVTRAGWVRVGVPAPESVAAHSWGMGWLVLCLCPPDLDRGRCLALATLHDLPEVIVGDLTPHDGVSKKDKHAREAQAAGALLGDHPELVELFQEYASQSSDEARFVRDIDKLDMALQALVYAPHADTREFVDSAYRSAQSESIRSLIDQVRTQLPL